MRITYSTARRPWRVLRLHTLHGTPTPPRNKWESRNTFAHEYVRTCGTTVRWLVLVAVLIWYDRELVLLVAIGLRVLPGAKIKEGWQKEPTAPSALIVATYECGRHTTASCPCGVRLEKSSFDK